MLESRIVKVERAIGHEAVPHLGAVFVVVGDAEARQLLFLNYSVLSPVHLFRVVLCGLFGSLAQALVECVVELLLENLILSLLLQLSMQLVLVQHYKLINYG